jgi:hypothetical protein
MADRLSVQPEELRIAAAHLSATASDLREAHAAAHASLSATAMSLGGSATGAALAERLAHWETETAAHHAELLTHSDNHITAAVLYTQTDVDGHDAIAAASDSIV